MLRVLHVFGGLDRGGAESRTMDIYRGINRDKIQFDFIVHTRENQAFSDEILSLGGKIYHLPRFIGLNYFAYKKAWRGFLSKHGEFGAVHIHMLSTAGIYISLLKNIPLRIAHARCASEPLSRHALIALNRGRIASHCTHLLAVSRMAANFMFGQHPAVVVPNAINARVFAYAPDVRKVARAELDLQGTAAIIHIGRFSKQKNHAFLLSVFEQVRKQIPEAVLILVGEGKLRSAMEQRAKSIGGIRFLGSRNDVPRLLQAMDIFVLPSYFEGLPGAAVEAQAAGLPCLLSAAVTPEARVIDDLIEYLPIDQGVRPWADAIARVVLDSKLRRDTSMEICAAGFNIESTAKWYENFYLNGDG